MDPLTHTLVGAVLGETGIGRRVRFGSAALLIGANLPDVDALSYLWGGDVALGFRRGWTHGILLLALQPFLLSALLVGIDRLVPRPSGRASFGRLAGLSSLAVLTHPFLDWLNTYGVRFLMPFDGRWFYGDGLFVVDPHGWLILGGAVYLARPLMPGWERFVWGLLALLASILVLGSAFVPAAARGIWVAGLSLLLIVRLSLSPGRRPRWAVAGLVMMTAYIAAMLTASTVISSRTESFLAAEGTRVRDVMASPLPANPLGWDVVASTPAGLRLGAWHWLDENRPDMSERLIPHPTDDPRVEAAFEATQVQGAVSWMRYPYVEIESTSDGVAVWILDARYSSRLGRGGFGSAVVHLDHQLRAAPAP